VILYIGFSLYNCL